MVKKKNNYIQIDDIIAIELYYPSRKEVEDYAYISKEDEEKVTHIFWRKTEFGYARGFDRNIGKEILLHKLITDTDQKIIIDHINRNKLDCRRCNLRIANKSVNSLNRSAPSNSKTGCAGVSFNKKKGIYRAYCTINGKQIPLGTYKTAEEAIKARKKFEEYAIYTAMNKGAQNEYEK